jgi:hypothetical protein
VSPAPDDDATGAATPPEGPQGTPSGAQPTGAQAPEPRAATVQPGGGSPPTAGGLEIVPAGELTVSEVGDSLPRQGGSYDIEGTRSGLAFGFLLIFAGTIAAVLVIIAVTGDHPAKEVSELLPTLIPAETALLGSAVGFYFGTKDR